MLEGGFMMTGLMLCCLKAVTTILVSIKFKANISDMLYSVTFTMSLLITGDQ